MAELKEVFEMVTKQTEPDLGSWKDQEGRQRRSTRNKRIGAFAVAAAIVAVAVTAVLVTRPGRDAEVPLGSRTAAPQSDPAPYFLDLRTGEETPLPEGLVGDDICGYTPSPDGTRIAFRGRASSLGTCSGVYGSPTDVTIVANIDGTEARTLPGPDGLNGYASDWVDDSKLLLIGRQGGSRYIGNLFVHDLTSEATRITDLELTDASWYWYEIHTDVSPDGQTVLFDLPRGSEQTTKWDIWSVPVTGGEPTLAVRNAAFPMYVSDGEEIAFVVPGPSNFIGDSIAIASADGSRRTLVQEPDLAYAPTVSPDGSRIVFPVGGSLMMVDVSTGEGSLAGDGVYAEWLDDDTLIVTP